MSEPSVVPSEKPDLGGGGGLRKWPLLQGWDSEGAESGSCHNIGCVLPKSVSCVCPPLQPVHLHTTGPGSSDLGCGGQELVRVSEWVLNEEHGDGQGDTWVLGQRRKLS